MKKLLALTLCSLTLAAGAALAEPPGKGGGKSLERMREHLDLTDEQVAEMRRIREEGGSREEVRAVLTDEQRAKVAEARRLRTRHMQEELDLTDEQVAQMREIREAGGSREEIHAVLTDEQREKLEARRAAHKGRKGKGPDES